MVQNDENEDDEKSLRALVLDLEVKPGEKRDESSFSETSWKQQDVHTLG